MADKVPVCDVLCEAMEYLSKLGSNLRARSENLKEKRIRKEKLKNYHAVQKAADKVLLICQLSKKSLENVESGVRNVLTILNESQSSKGVDVVSPKQSDKYQYFKYRSHKLKILKKVPIKHYMSAKVMARRMSLTMQDKYPVYYNCKLYRRRKEKLKSKENTSDDNNGDGILVEKENIYKPSHKAKNEVNSESNDDIEGSVKNSNHNNKEQNGGKSQSDKNGEKLKESSTGTVSSRHEGSKKFENNIQSPVKSRDSDLREISGTRDEKQTFVSNRSSKEVVSKKSDSRDKRHSSESSGKSKSGDERSEMREKHPESNRKFKDDEESAKKAGDKCHSSDSPSKSKDGGEREKSKTRDEKQADDDGSKKSDSRHKRRTSVSSSQYKDDDCSKKSSSGNNRRSSESHSRSKYDKENSKRSYSESGDQRSRSGNYDDDESPKISKSKSGARDQRQPSESHDGYKDELETVKNSESSNKRQSLETMQISTDSDGDERKIRSKKYGKAKFTNIRVIDDSSESSDVSYSGAIKKEPSKRPVEPNDTIDFNDNQHSKDLTQLHESKTNKLNVPDDNKTKKLTDTTSDTGDVSPEPVKPVIKCVSLTKLLKPNILEKVETIKPGLKSSKNDEEISTVKENSKPTHKKSNNHKNHPSKSDEEFWLQKRKDVGAFIAKNFFINMMRLPELSVSFLKIHNLKKITHSERVICEITNHQEHQTNKKAKESASSDNMNVLKSALLNDSDSEKSEYADNKSPIANITETVKSALLNDSEVDENNDMGKVDSCDKNTLSNYKIDQDPCQIKNDLLNDSDSDKTEKDSENTKQMTYTEKNKIKQDFLNIKKTLLVESDSEKNDNAESNIMASQITNDKQNVNDKQTLEQNDPQTDKAIVSPDKDQKQSDELDIPHSKRKKYTEGKLKSKRKRTMESMHAKKMLLTYSSSSDTEDEQLRNALKDIKNSLLEGSDEEKKKVVSNHSSSDSEEDILATKKKKGSKEGSCAGSESDSSRQSLKSDKPGKSHRKRDRNSSDDQKPKKKMGRSRAQPGGSSQNSDNQDDKDIDGCLDLTPKCCHLVDTILENPHY